ncbi:hypothetical protein NEHOM01_0707 [Nematocida homosporus]|uniref:uncharacterized protein n=1 Tax=Nematocida homosporus TaxID=1912981 RepID=UPI00221FCCD0|nr:uncharacterized protein NEHOM01_0707 [Nematocida homosporus]KAI5185249.1 hypothetical protein NEHOM01_0707 [Nematocida homosporus]
MSHLPFDLRQIYTAHTQATTRGYPSTTPTTTYSLEDIACITYARLQPYLSPTPLPRSYITILGPFSNIQLSTIEPSLRSFISSLALTSPISPTITQHSHQLSHYLIVQSPGSLHSLLAQLSYTIYPHPSSHPLYLSSTILPNELPCATTPTHTISLLTTPLPTHPSYPTISQLEQYMQDFLFSTYPGILEIQQSPTLPTTTTTTTNSSHTPTLSTTTHPTPQNTTIYRLWIHFSEIQQATQFYHAITGQTLTFPTDTTPSPVTHSNISTTKSTTKHKPKSSHQHKSKPHPQSNINTTFIQSNTHPSPPQPNPSITVLLTHYYPDFLYHRHLYF